MFLLADVARNIAEGNLNVEFKTKTGKENTGVFRDMEVMTVNLREMFCDIVSGTKTLTCCAEDLSAVSEQITKNTGQTAEKSSSVAASAEEMSTNMNSVAAATEQTTANIQMIVTAAEEMTATINEIATNMNKGSVTR